MPISSWFLVCGGTLRTENGTVTFPSNEGGSNVQGMDCGYRIQTTAGKVMNISFTQLRLRGPASYCPFDVVKVIQKISFEEKQWQLNILDSKSKSITI